MGRLYRNDGLKPFRIVCGKTGRSQDPIQKYEFDSRRPDFNLEPRKFLSQSRLFNKFKKKEAPPFLPPTSTPLNFGAIVTSFHVIWNVGTGMISAKLDACSRNVSSIMVLKVQRYQTGWDFRINRTGRDLGLVVITWSAVTDILNDGQWPIVIFLGRKDARGI